MDKLLSQVCYVCMVPCVSLKMIQDDRIWQSYMHVVWCYGYCLQASFLFVFCLKAFFVWPLLHNAQTKIAIVYMREQTCGTKDDMIPRLYGMYVMEGVDQWSLMCTSNVAGNTQMASLDRQVTQNGLGVINAIARMYNDGIPQYQDDMEVTVLGDDEWRCSWCRYQDDGDSSLSSRNTLGNGKNRELKISNVKCQMVVAGSGVGFAEAQWDCGNSMMGFGVRNAEVEGKVVYYTWFRSWGHRP